jgi:pilus assembly protein CpaD
MRSIVVATALLLAGCETYYVADYQERFPVAVQRETPLLLVAFRPGATELAPDEAARLDAFLHGYRLQHSGPLTVTAASAGAANRLAVERLGAIEARAIAAGIPKSFVALALADPSPGAGDAVVTYERYTAQVPECGDWTKNVAADWTNTPSSNFGCATQRNFGLMTADPKDLLANRGPGTRDATHMSDQIGKWRTGAPTVATPQEPSSWKGYFNPATGAAKE